MGRRALPKIDPRLDFSPYFHTLETAPRPLTSATLFGRDAPLELEMGSGKGLFLASAAAAQPERCFVGVELAPKYAQHAAARLAKRQLGNARMIGGDGLRLLAEWVPDATLAAMHVYFPDPWWKKRHRKRRVMRDTFVRDIERTLLPGGRLHFWSDVQEYFDESLELLATHTRLRGPLPVPERPPEHDLDYRTHFERRMRMHNLPVYRAEYEKAESEKETG